MPWREPFRSWGPSGGALGADDPRIGPGRPPRRDRRDQRGDNWLRVGSSYVVVDTGPWIFGRKVMLPAGTIDRIDWTEEKVHVDRTKDQIKDSPEYDESPMLDDADYRDRLGTYYGGTYAGRDMF